MTPAILILAAAIPLAPPPKAHPSAPITMLTTDRICAMLDKGQGVTWQGQRYVKDSNGICSVH